MIDLTRRPPQGALRTYLATTRVARFAASAAVSAVGVWLVAGKLGIGALIPGGLSGWPLAGWVSAVLALALAPFVLLGARSAGERAARGALALGFGHLAVGLLWGSFFGPGFLVAVGSALGHAAIGTLAGAVAGWLSWLWTPADRR